MKARHSTLAFAAVGLFTFYAAPSRAQEPQQWEWTVAPYLWAATIGTDLRTPFPAANRNSSFSVIDKLDGAFQAHVEGQNERFGMFGDFTYLGLADSRTLQRIATRSNLDSYLVELAAVWSPGPGRIQGVELFGGLRYIDVDLRVRLEPHDPLLPRADLNPNQSYSDLMLGARYTWLLGQRWKLTLRGDGSFGDTDGTWNASLVGQYRVKYGQWLLGYRYLSVEVADGRNDVDITLNGPMAGFGFVF